MEAEAATAAAAASGGYGTPFPRYPLLHVYTIVHLKHGGSLLRLVSINLLLKHPPLNPQRANIFFENSVKKYI